MAKLTKAQREIFLKEYEAANEFYRHHDVMGWTILNIFVPASYALLGSYVYLQRDFVPLAIASLTTNMVGIGMFLRMSDYTKTRQTRIFQIEELLGMNHHRMINRELRRKDIPLLRLLRYKFVTIHRLKWFQFCALLVAWILLGLRILAKHP